MQSHGGSRGQVGLARRRRDETGSVDCADAQRSKPKPPSPEQSARCRTTPVSIRLDSDEGPGPGGPGPNSSDPRNPPLGKRPFTDARPIAFALYTHIAAHPPRPRYAADSTHTCPRRPRLYSPPDTLHGRQSLYIGTPSPLDSSNRVYRRPIRPPDRSRNASPDAPSPLISTTGSAISNQQPISPPIPLLQVRVSRGRDSPDRYDNRCANCFRCNSTVVERPPIFLLVLQTTASLPISTQSIHRHMI